MHMQKLTRDQKKGDPNEESRSLIGPFWTKQYQSISFIEYECNISVKMIDLQLNRLLWLSVKYLIANLNFQWFSSRIFTFNSLLNVFTCIILPPYLK